MRYALIIGCWVVVSFVIAILVGKVIKAGQGDEE